MIDTAIIGVDWGSTSVRVMRIGGKGRILDLRRANDGVFTGSGEFEDRLRGHLGAWLTDARPVPIMLCGMIGSDRGWCSVAYAPAPAGLDDLARLLTPPPFDGIARIVPGVSISNAREAEVMRGEETLVMGLLAKTGLTDAILCLPGTHSKWVSVRDGRIAHFRTYMTGELRALLLENGALATGAVQAASRDAFLQGMKTSGTAVTRSLFQARGRRLLGHLPAEHTASFVSGVLIGEEVSAEAREAQGGVPIFIVAREATAGDYSFALTRAGLAHKIVDPEPLAALGLFRIAQQCGLA